MRRSPTTLDSKNVSNLFEGSLHVVLKLDNNHYFLMLAPTAMRAFKRHLIIFLIGLRILKHFAWEIFPIYTRPKYVPQRQSFVKYPF